MGALGILGPESGTLLVVLGFRVQGLGFRGLELLLLDPQFLTFKHFGF